MSEEQTDYDTNDPHGIGRSVRYEAYNSIPPVAVTCADEDPEVVLLEIDHRGIDKELDLSAAKALRACLDKAISEAEGTSEEDDPAAPSIDTITAFPSTPWAAHLPKGDDRARVWASDGDLVASVCESLPHHETHMDRARLIAAAGTAAQKASAMGYDPQKAVEQLPDLLKAAEEGSYTKIKNELAAMREGSANA